MGIFDVIGSILGGIVGDMAAKANEIQELKFQFDSRDSEELQQELRYLERRSDLSSSDRAMAIRMILRDRRQI